MLYLRFVKLSSFLREKLGLYTHQSSILLILELILYQDTNLEQE